MKHMLLYKSQIHLITVKKIVNWWLSQVHRRYVQQL
jgi:hypothetical protein